MADLAREEADRFFSNKERLTSHPEDREDDDDDDDEKKGSDFDGSDHRDRDRDRDRYERDSDAGTDDDDYDEDSHVATRRSRSRSTYHVPSTTSHANTGPKGVIADAQSFERAKQSTFRSKLNSFTQHISSAYNKRESWLGGPPRPVVVAAAATEKPSSRNNNNSNNINHKTESSHSAVQDSDEADEDISDSEFMETWRRNRLQELSAMSKTQHQHQQHQRRVSHQRTWGIVQDVDASGYLDAVEKAGADDVVVVLIYDATGSSSWSRSIELELGMLAYKYSRTRFVKLDQDIAEMESVEVPAVLAYRGGDVFATISGADADRLEDELKGYGVLPRSL